MSQTNKVRYGISDIVVDEDRTPSKYVQVYDENGKYLCDAEVYFIEEQHEEE